MYIRPGILVLGSSEALPQTGKLYPPRKRLLVDGGRRLFLLAANLFAGSYEGPREKVDSRTTTSAVLSA
jgi:hypothetical protein